MSHIFVKNRSKPYNFLASTPNLSILALLSSLYSQRQWSFLVYLGVEKHWCDAKMWRLFIYPGQYNQCKYLRTKNKLVVPCFNNYFMNHSIAHRGSILWNALSASRNGGSLQSVQTFCKMAKKDDTLLRMDFKALSVQSIPNFMPHFILS